MAERRWFEESGIGARLDRELVAWLTTVSPTRGPQPSMIWFVTEADHFVIYSKAPTPRLRNIEADARVAVHLNSDQDGGDLLIFEGEALIMGADVPPSGDATYVAKYEPHLARWDFTWETYDIGYPVRIHVHPRRIRT